MNKVLLTPADFETYRQHLDQQWEKAMGPNYEVCQYHGQWAIFDRKTRCYVLFGSKRTMTKRAAELNANR